jgi:5-dehydro-2-deoxygluconokinase
MQRGYDRALCILPFDHRGSFQAKMFGWKSPLSETQTTEISRAKEVIYDGFKAALANGVPKEKTGILVDEKFGQRTSSPPVQRRRAAPLVTLFLKEA